MLAALNVFPVSGDTTYITWPRFSRGSGCLGGRGSFQEQLLRTQHQRFDSRCRRQTDANDPKTQLHGRDRRHPDRALQVTVGNEKEGGELKRIPFREYVNKLQTYAGTKSEVSLLRERDKVLLCSAQACILPLGESGEVQFVPQIFNYQSSAIIRSPCHRGHFTRNQRSSSNGRN